MLFFRFNASRKKPFVSSNYYFLFVCQVLMVPFVKFDQPTFKYPDKKTHQKDKYYPSKIHYFPLDLFCSAVLTTKYFMTASA